ncbi:putative secondary metabolism biosynthetic enzyme [Pestalotiopsis sp. IQ-011]
MSRQNITFHLAERPTGSVVPGQTFEQKSVPAPTAEYLKDGQVLVEVLYLSLDPYMRGMLNSTRSYIAPVAIGQKMVGGAISRVLASKSPKAAPGDVIYAITGWTEVAIVPEQMIEAFKLPEGVKLTDMLTVAFNGPAMAAYIGLQSKADVQPGNTVVVSAASGATGHIVGQIAKIKGARVIGITGSDEKCRWLCDELGFDAALNYKSPNFVAKLEEVTPGMIDVYWDNVGGWTLEVALARAAKFARYVICGGAAQYNLPEPERQGIKNIIEIGKQRVRMEGFVVMDHMKDIPEARATLLQWITEGRLKTKETIVKGGITVADTAFEKLFTGDKLGKLYVEVKAP